MTVLVSVDTVSGGLRRYEGGGDRPRPTHMVECELPLPSIPPAAIEEFRRNPDLNSYVGPPVRPVPPTPPTGSPAMARAA